jgi:hypothetical protein
MTTQTVSTALVLASLVDGGAKQDMPNISMKTYQFLLTIPDSETSYGFTWPLDINFEYYIIGKGGKNPNNPLIFSAEPYVAPTVVGLAGVINNNQLLVNPAGLNLTEYAENLSTTDIYITMTGIAGDSMEVSLSGYSRAEYIDVEIGNNVLIDNNGNEIITNSGENITAEVS